MGEERGGLGGAVGGETIIRIHHVRKKKNLFFNERKKKNSSKDRQSHDMPCLRYMKDEGCRHGSVPSDVC